MQVEEFEDFDWVTKFSSKSISIPFGSKISRKILGEELCEEFKKRTEDLILESLSVNNRLSYKTSIQGGFPGSLAVSLLRSHLSDLSQDKYKIFFKSDGQRYFLCFVTLKSKEGKDEYLCYAINRSNEYFILSIHGLLPSVYEGTIFDGELVQIDEKNFEFQVFDCILGFGKSTIEKNHTERMRIAKECLQTLTSNQEFQSKNPFILYCKEYATIEEVLQWKTDDTQNYKTDGLILIKVNRDYVFGKDNGLWKWKEIYTVDFYVEIKKTSKEQDVTTVDSKESWDYYLYTFQKGNKKKLQVKGTATLDWLRFFDDKNHEYLKNDLSFMDGMLIECVWKENDWYPYRVRTDKLNANNEETYQLTLQNIREDIKFRDLMKAMGL